MRQHWNWMFGKVSEAVGILITNHGDVRNRVWVASDYLFMIHPDMVPPSCREDVVWIRHMLTRYPATDYYKSAVEATYYRTRNVTAAKIASRVWNLYHKFQSELEAQAAEERVGLIPVKKKIPQRKPGCFKGRISITPDFEEMPEELIKAFEGKS